MTILDGGAGDDRVIGGSGDDGVIGGPGDDLLEGRSGDDIIATGAGRDTVDIDPSNANEGADTITDFSLRDDSINFALADLLAADPDLPAADGDAASLTIDDFDASANWTLGASEAGNLLFTHPGGSVEFSDVAFSDQTFAELDGAIQVDGAEIPADGITDLPVEPEPPADGGEGADGGEPPVEPPPEDAIA
jgi:Ca2+-binding RTX toxin-like protein